MKGGKFLDTLTPPTSLPGEAAVGEWLSELVQTLQSQLDMVASGAAMLPYEYLTKRYLNESVPLGATANFQHETNGTLTGRFVKLGAPNTSGFARPVGYRTNSSQLYAVTDRVSESSEDLFAGLDITGAGETGEYGWILTGGVSPVNPEMTGAVSHLGEVGWVADDSLATNAATTVGRLISNGAELQVLLNAQPTPVNDKTLQGSIDRLNDRLNQMRTELATKPDSTSLNQLLQNLVVTSITAVNQTVDLIQTQLQKIDTNLAQVEIEQTLRAMADFRVELANAGQAQDTVRQQMHVQAQASLHNKESSKVWSDESGVYAEASAEAAARSAVSSNDSLVSAEAAQGFATSASLSEANALSYMRLSADYTQRGGESLPGTFESNGDFFVEGYNGLYQIGNAPIEAPYYSFPSVLGLGKVLQWDLAANKQDVSNRGVLAVKPGRMYRVRSTLRCLTSALNANLYMLTLDNSYTYTPVAPAFFNFNIDTTWRDYEIILSGDALIAYNPNVAYIRNLTRRVHDSTSTPVMQAARIECEDITGEYAAGIAPIPGDFTDAGKYFFTGYQGDPKTRVPMANPYGGGDFPVIGGVGRVARITTASASDISGIGVLPVLAGQIYRARCVHRTESSLRNISVYLLGMNASYLYTFVGGNSTVIASNTGWQTTDVTLSGDALLAAGIQWIRAYASAGANWPVIQIRELSIRDVSGEYRANASAIAAAGSQASASASEASSKSWALNSANWGRGYLNDNSNFANWDNYGVAYPGNAPPQWTFWNYLGGTTFRRLGMASMGLSGVQRPEASDWVYAPVVSATDATGLQTSPHFAIPAGQYLLEATTVLMDGSYHGSGVLVYYFDGGDSYIGESTLHFQTDPDITGFVGGNFATRRFSKRITAPAGTASCRLYAMANYNSSGFSPMAYKAIAFFKVGVKPIGDTEARVETNTGAIAGINGAAAFWETVVAAGGGFPAVARLKAGAGGSTIDLSASRLVVYNPSNTGVSQEVARFEGGQAKLNDAIIRKLQVGPRSDSTIYFPVQLKPRIFVGSDGQTITYETGKTMGAAPERIVPDLTGIPVGTGEALDVRATAVSATQFTVYAKKTTPSAPATQTTAGGTFTGGTPSVRTHKPTTADAYNGYYTYQFDVTLNLNYAEADFGGNYRAYYDGYVEFYIDSGSGWVLITTTYLFKEEYIFGFPPGTNTYFDEVFTFSWPNAIGQHGSYEFGIHPGAGASGITLDNVKYSTQTRGTVTALTELIPFMVYPPPAD